MILALALAAAQPVTTPPPPAASAASAPAAAPADPVRVAAARPVIDRVWPLGTYQRIMQSMVDQMLSGMMAGMENMPLEDFAGMAGDKKTAVELKGKTLGDVTRQADPYFRERGERTMKVMFTEMGRIMGKVEPQVREALANAYARRFTVAQLNDLDRFFATPTGAAYAAESMTLMMGPDMMGAMQSFAPRLIKEMPALMKKVDEATKDLPPPPKPKTRTP